MTEKYLKTVQQLAEEGAKIKLTDNQFKVAKNKYLRKDNPEIWMRGVCRNIALGDVLNMPNLPEGIFEGVDYKIVRSGIDNISRILLLHREGSKFSDRSRNFSRFMENLNKVAETDEQAAKLVKAAEQKFYHILSNFLFLPNSPTLMNAGRGLQQLSACYVLPVGDSIEEIYSAVTNMAIVHKSGGGTGFAFSRLRPTNDIVKTTLGIASGPLSFMKIFDTSTEVVKQGGTRRGANMGILHYTHPNIKDFITSKSKDKSLFQNFNISVAISEEFMKKVANNEDYELLNPRNKEVLGHQNARDIFDLMTKCAWETGDPGFVVIDRINGSDSNPTPHLGEIESTNPCGEQPLLPYEACNLGSINLSKFVRAEDIDWEFLRKIVHDCVHFLDNVIEVNNYPLPEIERIVKGNRKIGLGVMGWAETLIKLGIPYDSSAAIKKGEEVMKFINDAALEYSCDLAKTRGTFPNWKDSIFDKDGENFRGLDVHPRNSTRTTIAPTGTIAITAGLQGSGIEPFFAIAYKRFQAEAVDKVKKGEAPDEQYVFYESVPLFVELASKNGFWGLEKKVLMQKISDNHGSVRGIKEIPAGVQQLFCCAHDVHWRTHIDHQAAFQRHVNNAVSKTINLPNDATVDDIKEAYRYAINSGLKGITVYRDGCKDVQVLNTGKTKDQADDKPVFNPDLREGIQSDYFEIPTGYGNLHVSIAYDPNQGPFRIFTSIPPIGTELSSLVSTLGVFMSKAFQHGYSPERAIKHLNSAKGDKPIGFGSTRIDSIPHAISVALRKHLDKTGKLRGVRMQGGQTILSSMGNGHKIERPAGAAASQTGDAAIEGRVTHCPSCYSPNIAYQSGCSGPTCFDCGHSECS
ncbi:MAG: adenosylcobalamin-dependent ribonucleoside-diphosphate reductase [Candidatus Nanoarchaeia archaeon]